MDKRRKDEYKGEEGRIRSIWGQDVFASYLLKRVSPEAGRGAVRGQAGVSILRQAEGLLRVGLCDAGRWAKINRYDASSCRS